MLSLRFFFTFSNRLHSQQLYAVTSILLNLVRELRKGRELPVAKRDSHDDQLRLAAAECHAVLAYVAALAKKALVDFRTALLRTQASRTFIRPPPPRMTEALRGRAAGVDRQVQGGAGPVRAPSTGRNGTGVVRGSTSPPLLWRRRAVAETSQDGRISVLGPDYRRPRWQYMAHTSEAGRGRAVRNGSPTLALPGGPGRPIPAATFKSLPWRVGDGRPSGRGVGFLNHDGSGTASAGVHRKAAPCKRR